MVRDEDDRTNIDIGEYDSPATEAVAAAAYLVTGDLINPDDDRFHTAGGMLWIVEGTAESRRHTILRTIPDPPWHQEELPPELESSRRALLALTSEQRHHLQRTPELDPTLYAVQQLLPEASLRREARRTAAWDAEELEQCNVIREMIRPPFLMPFASSMRSATVLAVARGIYDERAFDRMPMLADALRDAECADEWLLGHCHGPGPHLRGCWAINLVFGRA